MHYRDRFCFICNFPNQGDQIEQAETFSDQNSVNFGNRSEVIRNIHTDSDSRVFYLLV